MKWDRLLKLAKKYERSRERFESDPNGLLEIDHHHHAVSLARAFVAWTKEHPAFSSSFAVADRIDRRVAERATRRRPGKRKTKT